MTDIPSGQDIMKTTTTCTGKVIKVTKYELKKGAASVLGSTRFEVKPPNG